MASSFCEPCSASCDEARDQEQGAFIRQVRQELVAYFIRRLPSPDDAEDLAHEVLLRLLRHDDPDSIVAMKPYLFEIAKNILIDRNRRGRIRCEASHEPLSDDMPDEDQVECERTIMAREDMECVRTGLMNLPDRTRSIFILRRMEGMRHQEIAGNLGVSLSTVEKHVRLAVQHLKGCMENAA